MNSESSIRIAIHGASGRMGLEVLKAANARSDCAVAAALVRAASPWVGEALAGALGVCATARYSSAWLARPLTLSSPQKTKASPESWLRSRFSAKFRRASGNHFAPGIRLASMSARAPRLSATTPAKSHSVAQNCSGCVTDQRCSAS